MSCTTKNIPIYSVQIPDAKKQFSFKTEINKIEKSILLKVANPKYHELQNKYPQLKDIEINEVDTNLKYQCT